MGIDIIGAIDSRADQPDILASNNKLTLSLIIHTISVAASV